jgi:hypothetical protein
MKYVLAAVTGLSIAFAAPHAFAEDTIIVPDTVTTYVTEQPMDETTIEGDIVIGSSLPDTVVIKNVPDNDGFGYTVVNKRRIIVEPKTRKVVKIIE